MPYINLINTKIYYEDEGTGDETLVFGHSMLFNLRMFDNQVANLKGEYRCIRFDFRGHGKSEITEKGYDLDTQAEDIVELIRKLQCNPCHFIGFSMGGMIALRIAVKYPKILKSLILIDTSSEPEPTDKMLKNRAMLFIARYIGLWPIANQVMSLFFGTAFLTDPARKDLRSTWKNHFLANDRIGIARAVKGVLFRKGISDQLSSIDHQTTIMVGAKDQLTDISKAQIMYSKIEHSTLKVVPRAGHMSPVEEPDSVSKIIREHLENFH